MIKANKKFVIGIAVAMGTIALAGLLAMNVNAQPSGFVFIDENGNGQFDNDEIYMYQYTTRRWQPLVPGVLPFPVLPVFPY